MSIDSSILRRLAAVDMSPAAFREVLSIIADIKQFDEERKAKQRDRTAKSRYGNVTVTAQERDGNSDKVAPALDKEIPPTPPKENSTLPPSKQAKRARSLPDDWQANDRNIRFAKSQGGTDQTIPVEAQRFVSHHRAKGSLMKDWDMAWQTWWLSPIRSRGTGPPGANVQPRFRNGAAALIAKEFEREHPAEFASWTDRNHRTAANGQGLGSGSVEGDDGLNGFRHELNLEPLRAERGVPDGPGTQAPGLNSVPRASRPQ